MSLETGGQKATIKMNPETYRKKLRLFKIEPELIGMIQTGEASLEEERDEQGKLKSVRVVGNDGKLISFVNIEGIASTGLKL